MMISKIEAAAACLAGHARVTPLLNAPLLDAEAGRRIYVKAECLQKTGSFKYRGGRSALSVLDAETRARGVLAYSSGNHAQGVALAAREFGVPAVIVMPADAPRSKIDATRAYGAEVVLYDREAEDRDEIGAALAEARRLTLIKPFDNEDVIAGQGTTGLEIAAQAAELGIKGAKVLVPCGGGGLTSGIAAALAARAPGLVVHPVEPEGFDDVARSLSAGAIVTNNRRSGSVCDAILTPAPGVVTFPLLAAHARPGLTVTDAQALAAVATAFRYLRIVVEPGGAVALAAALALPGDEDVIAVASGGNIDPVVFTAALAARQCD